MVIVKFLWLIGSETVHGAKCHQAEWDCPSSIHHSILWDPVPRLQNFHQWAVVSHLVNAKRHHVCYTGALWKCSGTSFSCSQMSLEEQSKHENSLSTFLQEVQSPTSSFICQHGEPECKGNMIQVYNLLPAFECNYYF